MVNQTMKRRDWIFVIGAVLAVWGADQLTKALAQTQFTEPIRIGPLGFMLHMNPGIIFGTFAKLPPLLRVVSLSTSGAFMVFIFGAVQYLLPSRSMLMRIGMALLLGGILGNVTDRIAQGAVVDFVYFQAGTVTSPVFNLADAIQWVGYLLLCFGLLKDGQMLWPDSNARRTVWVNPGFQLKFCLLVTAIGFGFAVISGVFAYTFLKVTIDDLVVGSPLEMEKRFLNPFLQTYAVISTGFLLMLFVFARILSHRLAGPIHAFENYIRDLLDGKDRKLKLRKGDEFRTNLEELAEKLSRERLE